MIKYTHLIDLPVYRSRMAHSPTSTPKTHPEKDSVRAFRRKKLSNFFYFLFYVKIFEQHYLSKYTNQEKKKRKKKEENLKWR